MSSSFPKCNQAGIEYVISTDENLKEHILFLSDHFPVAMFTQTYTLTASDSIPLHWHDELQLIWVFEGELAYSVNGDTFSLDSGSMLFISSRQLHCSNAINQDAKALCFNFSMDIFHPLILEHYLIPLFQKTKLSYTHFPLKPYQILRLKELLCWEPNPLGYFFIMNFISQIFEDFLKDYKGTGNTPDQEEAEQFHSVLTYVHTHFAKALTIKELSSYALVNKNKLTFLFKKYTNMSPIKYLNEYRLYMAKKWLLTTDKSISEISTAVGYHQASHFIQQFRDRYGVSPLKFRNQYRNKDKKNETL